MNTALSLLQKIKLEANPEQAAHSQRFFKTGKGQYGEGDIFLGLSLPQINDLVKQSAKIIELDEVEKLFCEPYHEARSLAVSILVWKYTHAKNDMEAKKAIVNLYLSNRAYINNWDLVDISVYKILGAYVYENKDISIFHKLASEDNLWSQRMSVVGCMFLIKKDEFADFKVIAKKFLTHQHDLMHKAVGWILREMGKRNQAELLAFLDAHTTQMPRTMLRYSLEKLTPEQRRYYMDMK